MASVSVQLPLSTVTSTYTALIASGILKEAGGAFYTPFVIDNFSAPNISITGCTLTAAATKIVGTASAFNNVRVGDVVTSVSSGTLTAKSAIAAAGLYTVQSLPYLIYPTGVNVTTLGIKSGDAVEGTGIAANTKVDKLDTANRIIYLTANCTATGIQSDITFTPPVRVTAVRISTATVNPNEIDIDSTVATSGAASTAVITPGAGEAVIAVLKVLPVSNSTGGTLNFSTAIAYTTGLQVRGSVTGYSEIDFTALNYVGLGSFGIDVAKFLLDSRVPRS